MNFSATSTIHLCNVPFDNTYKNQIYFENQADQIHYFSNLGGKTLTNYNVVRKNLPNGIMESSIRVQGNIDELQKYNYLYYQNLNHGIKWYYAFITKILYIKEDLSEIVFECDCFQTWLFDIKIQPSFVIREHSKTDKIGDNLVPEKFNFQDYVYTDMEVENPLEEWGYLIATTVKYGTEDTRGSRQSGIYQGLFFYYYEDTSKLNGLLDALEEDGEDCIVFIAVIPRFNIPLTDDAEEENRVEGLILGSDRTESKKLTIPISDMSESFGDYIPINNKLHTYPYECFEVTNHNGEQCEYRIEDFWDRNNIEFWIEGDISANPSVVIYPVDYQGIFYNYDSGLSIGGFPQCSYNSDTFKLWLAKNQYGLALDTMGNIGQIVTGIATSIGSGGTATAIGVAQAVSGSQGILSTINSVYQASKEPNRTSSGSSKNNLLTAMGNNCFTFYHKKIKEHYARMIDDFFTMYGYQTNALKKPNLNSRPCYNYVQTADINITGTIPNDDMQIIKSMFNNGVTLWKPNAIFGDYAQDNTPQ